LQALQAQAGYFVVALSWAAAPTIVLLAISVLKPVYVDRYVTASVPGLAIALSLPISWALSAATARWSARWVVTTANVFLGAALLAIVVKCSVPSAQQVYENLEGAANYLASHVGQDGESALLDHSVTTVVDYYLSADRRQLPTWPQIGNQPVVVSTLNISREVGDPYSPPWPKAA
jgi:hypothetical protein